MPAGARPRLPLRPVARRSWTSGARTWHGEWERVLVCVVSPEQGEEALLNSDVRAPCIERWLDCGVHLARPAERDAGMFGMSAPRFVNPRPPWGLSRGSWIVKVPHWTLMVRTGFTSRDPRAAQVNPSIGGCSGRRTRSGHREFRSIVGIKAEEGVFCAHCGLLQVHRPSWMFGAPCLRNHHGEAAVSWLSTRNETSNPGSAKDRPTASRTYPATSF
ncbi:hypothetical protein GLOTRDRAFT_131145 [Gloeophyllum trabeum ATCC 11539]|uniref:Uncharacterized protein n=1 Tax=Gloeophyllum trabeum (strain ATCC 11539 / FP-39264 / Madison 617) TaxID=670483 RepID=S7RM72_GLOTA|nr:uncharacterized protein GLOTRDRAFT_131145 [Gloeophyllum trabeum ATCC 11539]EPQ53814.1 hypothetical protein GLOTRDRAFT_131145 [Gloeophyllum trabeum ATCC 11539]